MEATGDHAGDGPLQESGYLLTQRVQLRPGQLVQQIQYHRQAVDHKPGIRGRNNVTVPEGDQSVGKLHPQAEVDGQFHPAQDLGIFIIFGFGLDVQGQGNRDDSMVAQVAVASVPGAFRIQNLTFPGTFEESFVAFQNIGKFHNRLPLFLI